MGCLLLQADNVQEKGLWEAPQDLEASGLPLPFPRHFSVLGNPSVSHYTPLPHNTHSSTHRIFPGGPFPQSPPCLPLPPSTTQFGPNTPFLSSLPWTRT